MKNKRVVVTGGAGFIGSNIVHALYQDNEVIVIDDLSTGHQKNIAGLLADEAIVFERSSILDAEMLQRVFADVDVVFHQAAIPSVPRSVKDPVTSNEVNITGTLQVLIAARDAGVDKVVYASSSSVYGDTPTLPKEEGMMPMPLSPYAVAKLAGEYYCKVFAGVYDLPTVALRYFNVFGPRQDPNGEYAAVIPKFILRMFKGEPLVIFGDGLQTRDFTFIDNVVSANVLAAESSAVGVFNVACGERITLNRLAEALISIHGTDNVIEYTDPRPGDIMHSLADVSKAKTMFSYDPVMDIMSGLKQTYDWFKTNAE